jgi:hypothetical protein
MNQQFPVRAKESENQSKERKKGRSLPQVPGDSAVVMFSKYITWAMMQLGYEAEHYARDLRASQAECSGSRAECSGMGSCFIFCSKKASSTFQTKGLP